MNGLSQSSVYGHHFEFVNCLCLDVMACQLLNISEVFKSGSKTLMKDQKRKVVKQAMHINQCKGYMPASQEPIYIFNKEKIIFKWMLNQTVDKFVSNLCGVFKKCSISEFFFLTEQNFLFRKMSMEWVSVFKRYTGNGLFN